MRIYGLLGYPLNYSLSPAMHNAAFQALGIDAHYYLWPTHPTKVEGRVTDLRNDQSVGGFNITVPHKQAVTPLLDDISPAAKAVGAVNTVTKREGALHGKNTDVYGFQQMLLEAHVPVQGQQVLILGAGGAARAAVYALLQMGVGNVWVLNRTPWKAAQLLHDLYPGETGGRFSCLIPETGGRFSCLIPGEQINRREPHALGSAGCFPVVGLDGPESITERPLQSVLGQVSVVVNATSSQDPWAAFGLTPDLVWPTGNGWAVDLMYGNMLAGFLGRAREHQWHTLSGEGMLLHQAAEAFELWTGQAAPVEVMRTALMAALRG